MADGFSVQVVLPPTTGLPRDVSINTWSITAGPPPVQLDEALESFYNDPVAGVSSRPLSSFLSGSISRAVPVVMRAYDLQEPEPRQPIPVGEFVLGNAATFPLPQEVAICSSFTADVPPGGVPARYRGRVYIGPLNVDAMETSDQVGRPAPDLIEIIAGATKRLTLQMAGRLGVWSRTQNVVRPVVRGYVDNEFDTQRRRGRAATSRVLWS